MSEEGNRLIGWASSRSGAAPCRGREGDRGRGRASPPDGDGRPDRPTRTGPPGRDPAPPPRRAGSGVRPSLRRSASQPRWPAWPNGRCGAPGARDRGGAGRPSPSRRGAALRQWSARPPPPPRRRRPPGEDGAQMLGGVHRRAVLGPARRILDHPEHRSHLEEADAPLPSFGVVQNSTHQAREPSTLRRYRSDSTSGLVTSTYGGSKPASDLVELRHEGGRPRFAAAEATQDVLDQPAVALVGGEPARLGPGRGATDDTPVSVGPGHLLGDVRLAFGGRPDIGPEGRDRRPGGPLLPLLRWLRRRSPAE